MDIKQTIQKPIESEFAAFRQYYYNNFNSEIPLLNETLVHVSGSTGKMMRPMLVLLAAKGLGKVNDVTFSAAAALELLHTASLMHDDVIDESHMRRGIPSVNAVYGNRIAILTGDYLFSSALFNAAKTKNHEIIEHLSRLGRTLSSGEMLQIELQKNGGFSEENYLEVVRCKTASLFSACGRFGALSADADKEVVDAFARFGELLGICFQMKDDIFDYFDSNIGKPTGSDMREGKITLPALYALRTSSNSSVSQLKEKIEKGTSLTDDEILFLIDLSKKEGGVEYAQKRINDFRTEALSILPKGVSYDCREAMVAYLDYVINREK